MAIVQSPEKQAFQESKEKPRYKITPRYSVWLNDGKFIVEVALPGVSKENIKMKALEDYFTLRADRDNITYTLDLDLNFKIEPEKVTTKYSEGLLHVEFERFDPLARAHVVLSRNRAEKEDFYKVYPRIYKYTDHGEKTIKFEISIPGVKQEDIELKVLPEWIYLSAVRPGENMEYAANVSLDAEVKPEKTTAEYYQGLLKITVAIRDPIDDAKQIVL